MTRLAIPLALSLFAALPAFTQTIPGVPYQKWVLPNGLTLIVHEDHKAPIVCVNVWYHVGSKNEKPGKTGFAHLFEHLMFNGSENNNDDYFQVMERIGATELNGTTNNDRTNYFQNVPVSAFDTALWMESDRMGHLLGAIDQKRLDEQRGVVQNEKRQSENQPYAVAFELATTATYPKGHPYSWTVIGSMDDLSAASLKDVQDWFKLYYGAANATIVIAGDIDPKVAKEKVEKYFGAIPAGPPLARHRAWPAKRTESMRQMAHDRVPQARIYKIWNGPELADADYTYLEMAALILGTGKNSRLYKRLVYDDQIATDVSADMDQNEIANQITISATAKAGGDLAKVEAAVNEEIGRFLRDGPTAEELGRARTRFLSAFLRSLESIGGFGGKSDLLATSEVFGGSPDSYKIRLQRIRDAKPEDLRGAAGRWMTSGDYNLEIHPFPKYDVAPKDADRSKVPPPSAPPALKLPTLQRSQLSNGLKIMLAERHEAPVVNLNLQFDAGTASDQFNGPGVASLAARMLMEGTANRGSLDLGREIEALGARITAGSGLDTTTASLSALKMNLDASLNLFADIVLNPAFPPADFDRVKKLQFAQIQREKSEPFSMALRVFPVLVYGNGHAYGAPLTGSGTEESLAKIQVADLKKFHQTWFRPNNATLLIVGDTTLAEIAPKLEKLFGGWKAGEVPKKNLATVAHRAKPELYIVDQPGAEQSVIIAGHVAPPTHNPDEIAIETMNNVLGGAFTSRINMNLREDKHWSYGASSFLFSSKGQSPFIAFAPVQTDKTKESVQEMMKEIRGIVSDKLPTDGELAKQQANQTLSLPGSRETGAQVMTSLEEIVRLGLPDDYYEKYPAKVRALKTTDLSGAAEKVLRPNGMIWVIVGDKERIEKSLKELGLGDPKHIDADGNPAGR